MVRSLFKKIAVDLGSSAVRVWVRGEGIVLRERALVALDPTSRRVMAIGQRALELAGTSPRTVEVVWPVRDGAFADVGAAVQLITHVVGLAQGRQRLFRPEVVVCVPTNLGGPERRALTTAAIAAGARQAWLLDGPLAAAIGAGLPVAERRATAVCDLGAGTTDVAVISLSGVVAAHSAPAGADIAETVRAALAQTPSRLAADVRVRGLVLTGGRARIRGLGRELAERTGMPVRVADEPDTCAVRGAAEALDGFELLSRGQPYMR